MGIKKYYFLGYLYRYAKKSEYYEEACVWKRKKT